MVSLSMLGESVGSEGKNGSNARAGLAESALLGHAPAVQLTFARAGNRALRPDQPERLPCVDALRGLMALCVAAYHFSSLSHAFAGGSRPASLLALGGIYSVQGFFIVSGLCFFHSYRISLARGPARFDSQTFGAREAQRFYVRRFFRIAPLYYSVLLLNLCLGQAVWPRFSWGRIAENVSLSFGFFHPNHAMVIGGWSIGIECVFYLAFPLLLWLCRLRGALWIALLALAALPLLLHESLRSAPEAARFHAYVRVPNHAFLFLLGAACARVIERMRLRIDGGWLLGLAGYALLLGVALLPRVWDHFALMIGAPRAWGVAICTLLVLLAACGKITRHDLFAPFRLLGDLSYAVYLLHPFAWQLIAALPQPALDAKARFGLALVLSLLMAYVVHRLLERPLLAWGRRLSERKDTAGAARTPPNFASARTGALRRWSRVRALLLGLLLCLAAGCDRHDRTCANERCVCPAGESCEIECKAPPCNITCRHDSECEATCANGSCVCEHAASCTFDCKAPPCHVECAGDHDHCDGTCANGTCSCGPDSSCLFTCQSGPCHSVCPAGAECVVLCPNGAAGTQDCDIVQCAAGTPTICGDGYATTCNAECPEQPMDFVVDGGSRPH
jgi:peptidoglycan/LPS O-acetylase OafA/YrhL